jgi:cytochrome c oxidase subunit 3
MTAPASNPGAAGAHLQAHFSDLEQQGRAARLGMWIFLGTEVLLFAGLFVAYGYYRALYGAAFAVGSRHLDRALGTIETLVLITSSLCVAVAPHFARARRLTVATLLISAAALLGVAFLAIHGFEYAHDGAEGALPGIYYHLAGPRPPGVPLFFSLYFLMTSLHGLHVAAGVGVLTWLGAGTARGAFSSGHDDPLELGALYWHLVDLVWIFLYPLLYLV